MYWHIQNKFTYIYNILAKHVTVLSQIGLQRQNPGDITQTVWRQVFFFCYFTLDSSATIDLVWMELVLSVKHLTGLETRG